MSETGSADYGRIPTWDEGIEQLRAKRVRVLGQELDAVLADLDNVVVGQQLLLDRLAVDVGAVGAVQVFDEHVRLRGGQDGVLAADGQVVDDDVVVRPAAERGALLRDLELLDHDVVERDDEFAH